MAEGKTVRIVVDLSLNKNTEMSAQDLAYFAKMALKSSPILGTAVEGEVRIVSARIIEKKVKKEKTID